MSAPVERPSKKRTMDAGTGSQDDVEAKKRKPWKEEEGEDVDADKCNNGSEQEEDVESKKRTNGGEKQEEEASQEEDVESKKRNNGREEKQEEEASDVESKKRNNGRVEKQEEEASQEEDVKAEKRKEKDSSLVLLPGAELYFSDPKAFFAAFYKDEDEEESDPEVEVPPTLDHFKTPTRFHTRELLPIREPGSKAVLSAAKFLLGISSSVGGKPLKRCSGFWIDFDEGTKTGTVLTTAHLICTKVPPDSSGVWTDRAEYDINANVTVHLLDGTSAEGQLLYHQPHYDLAFLSVKVDRSVQLPSFNEGVKFSQKVLRLGRDNSSKLRIRYGRAAYLNPNMYERYHNMYFDCADYDSADDYQYDDGGLVIDLNGEIVGMVNISRTLGSFIPSSILLKCWASWENHRLIRRPHLGMTFEAIKLLEPAYVDNIWCTYNIDDGLIVQQVSKGSHADNIGIERGDIIESFNGRCISTTVELENMLMSISNDTLDSQSEVQFSVGVFHTLKKQRMTALLSTNLSDLGEVIAKGP